MKLHRFYVADTELTRDFWLKNEALLHQWRNVLRFRENHELVLFDGVRHERLYKIVSLKKDTAHLVLVTDFERNVPAKDVYLLWSLLKKDKNDWILQKATELGVSHFVPLLADRSEKTGFDTERAKKIVIEASEQSGRGDVPDVREPIRPKVIIEQLETKSTILVAQEKQQISNHDMIQDAISIAIMIGPEGGWSETEKKLFNEKALQYISLGQFTLRAETAAIVATERILNI